MVRYLFYTIGDLTYQSPLVHTTKKRTETLLVSSKKIGLDVNADKTMYMVKSRSDCRIKWQHKDQKYIFWKGGKVQVFWNNLTN